MKAHRFRPHDFSSCDVSLSLSDATQFWSCLSQDPVCHIPGCHWPPHTSQHAMPQQESHLPESSTCWGLAQDQQLPDRVWAQDPGTPGYQPGGARLHCLETTAHDPQSLLRGHGCHCRFPQGSVRTSFPKETCFFVIPSF